jgi:hypothetical protein
VRPATLDVDDEADAAGVVLVSRVVETLSGRRSGHGWSASSFSHRCIPFVKTVAR